MRRSEFLKLVAAGAAGLAAAPGAAVAQGRPLTFTSWGGAFQEAERNAFLQPFTAGSGIAVLEDTYSGELARIRSQVETGSLTWDIVNVTGSMLVIGCEQGLFEPLDWNRIGRREDFLPVAVHECGVGVNAGATVMTFDRDRFPAGGPTSWADMWDLTRFPGTRGFRFDPKFTLEAALLADGVPRSAVYDVLKAPGGIDRAFAKLDQIKPQIRWWRSGAESVQLLASGAYAIASAYYGRVFSLNASANRNFQIVRSAGTFQEFSYYVLLKGSRNAEQAYALLRYAAQPAPQATYTRFYPYGPGNRLAYDLVAPENRANLLSPVGADENTIFEDAPFWVENLDEVQRRFSGWAAR